MRKLLSISVLLPTITLLMATALVTTFSVVAIYARERRENAAQALAVVDISRNLLTSMRNIRLERGGVFDALRGVEVAGINTPSDIKFARKQANDSLAAALAELSMVSIPTNHELEEIQLSSSIMTKMRNKVDIALRAPNQIRPENLGTDWISANLNLILAIDDLSLTLANYVSRNDAVTAELMKIEQLSWAIRDDAGNDRLMLATSMFAKKKLSLDQQQRYSALRGRVDSLWRVIIDDEKHSSVIPQELMDAIDKAQKLYFTDLRRSHDAVLSALTTSDSSPLSPHEWIAISDPGLASLFAVTTKALDLTAAHADLEYSEAQRNFYIAAASVVFFFGMGFLALWIVVVRVVGPIARITEAMDSVAGGKLTQEIPFEDRDDEIGHHARALRVFVNNARENQRLQVAKESAEASNRIKSEFLANMSHELRTPLNAIIGFSETIKDEVMGPIGHKQYKGYVTDIYNSGTHLLGLINDVLDISKFESGKLELELAPVDITRTVADCAQLMRPLAEKAKIRLTVSMRASLPYLNSDERRIRQIILNLVSNGIKFTPEGGTVDVCAEYNDASLSISVADTGIGMETKDIPVALERFGQIDSKLNRKYEGTGLGLPLSKRLTEMLGGTLNVESSPGTGTTVIVGFPAEYIISTPKVA